MKSWYKTSKDREYPIAAAIYAGGKFFTGRNHAEALQNAIQEGYAIINSDDELVDKDGNDMTYSGAIDLFLTNKGRYINRFQSSMMGEATGAEYIPEKDLDPKIKDLDPKIT
ncbi:MAG: hypothetical protein WC119_01040 [Synergistaceae bacterium]